MLTTQFAYISYFCLTVINNFIFEMQVVLINIFNQQNDANP